MTLIFLSCAWVTGIYLGSITGLPVWSILFGLIPLLVSFLFPEHRKTLLLAGLCLVAFGCGNLRFQSNLPVTAEHYLYDYNNQGIVEIRGMVDSDPEVKDTTTLLHFSAGEIIVDREWHPISGVALVRVPRVPHYNYGDILKITGKLETPPQLDNFDYQDYLTRQGIYSVIFYPGIEVLETGKGFMPLSWVYSLRSQLSQSLSTALPEPQGSLAQGILLGFRGNIPDSLRAAFSRTGTAHLLAISGLHISVVIGILLSAGIWLFGRQRSLYLWLALGVIWLYALLTGMRPPVIRAVIMGSLFLFGEYLGRQRSTVTALALAAAVMVGFHPQILWQVAFQLSFLAMTGLIFLAPTFRRLGRRATSTIIGEQGARVTLANNLVDTMAITISAILATWPLIAHNFGIVSLVGLPATFFTLPALPGIIITSALVGGVGIAATAPAQILGWVAWFFLTYMITVIHAFDALPFSAIELASFPGSLVWGYYVLLAASVLAVNNKAQVGSLQSKFTSTRVWLRTNVDRLPLKWLLLTLLIIAIPLWTVILSLPDDRLHVSFLDVGQGDAILIQTPDHQDILIDGGPSPQAINLELSKKMPFWDKTIDLMVLTHPQDDHVAGLVAVLKRYKVEQVLEPEFEYNTSTYQEWLRLIDEKNIKRTIARAGQEIMLGKGVIVEVLHPQQEFLEGTDTDVNNNSVVLRLAWDEISFLLTGDIQEEAEWELIAQRSNLKATVLKVAHHGSDTSTLPEFLSVVNPQLAVISVAADNSFGHPSSELLVRLNEKLGKDKVYLTSEQGAIEFITDGERLWVKTER